MIRGTVSVMRMLHCSVVAATLVASSGAHATCAMARIGPRVMTTRSTVIPADGGVLVGYQFGGTGGEFTDDDPSAAAGWTASDGTHPIGLTRISLAPGLSVWKLAGNAPTTITGKDAKPIGAFTHDAKLPAVAMPAPQPTSATTSTAPSFRSSTTTSTVTLAKAPPPDAVALIVYAAGAPITYAQLPDTHDKLTKLAVFEAGGRCALPMPGHALSSGTYTFAYVDAFGRLSPQSKPLRGKS